jgi:hypothetical protein
MTQVLARCRDYKADKVVHIYFEEVLKKLDQFIPFR